MGTKIQGLWNKFSAKAFRDAFWSAHLSTNIAGQLATMREDRGWTQSQLAEASGMAQSRVSLLEDPAYDRMSVSTLKRLATAFDVALSVRFVPHSELLRSAADPSSSKLSVDSFAEDAEPRVAGSNWTSTAMVHTTGGSARSIRATADLSQSLSVSATATPERVLHVVAK